MRVYKFGRHHNVIKVRAKRALQEDIAFKVIEDGYVDMENKNISNLGEPKVISDAIS